jgi:hypothetical protein
MLATKGWCHMIRALIAVSAVISAVGGRPTLAIAGLPAPSAGQALSQLSVIAGGMNEWR